MVMRDVSLGDICLEYESVGSGDPLLFIQGAFIADTFRPLLREPSLEQYKLINYHRRGYAGSTKPSEAVTISQHAADALALLNALGINRAHIVGHSYGGCVALQLALDASRCVQSLVLLEPAVPVGASGEEYRHPLIKSANAYATQNVDAVVDAFLMARWGDPQYRKVLDDLLPGAFNQAVGDAATWFHYELPGLLDWTFGQIEATRITQPAVSILGGDSSSLSSRFPETHFQLIAWLRGCVGEVLPNTAHFPQLQDTTGLAELLARFISKHPIPG